MPVKTWEPPPGQHDRDPQLSEAYAAEPRTSDTLTKGADRNDDARSFGAEVNVYGDEDINTHGSER